MTEWIIVGVIGGLILAMIIWKNWPEKAKAVYDAADKFEDQVQDKIKEQLKTEESVTAEEAVPANVVNEVSAPKKRKRAAKKRTKK